MFSKQKELKHSVYLKLRIATNIVSEFCGERTVPESLSTIKSATSLNSYDSSIQFAETSFVPGSQLWFHHGPSTFSTTPNMVIDVGDKIEQLSFEIVDKWFSVETTYSNICLFYAPIDGLNELMLNGHLGYTGVKGKTREVSPPGDLNWLEPVTEKIDGGMTNKEQNGITVTYTNEAFQLIINKVFDLGEHQQVFED